MLLATPLASFTLFATLSMCAGFDKLAPFTAVRWAGNTPEIQVNGSWSGVQSIDTTPIEDILSFSRATYGGIWQKRFSEDLVEVLSTMGNTPGDTVQLTLIHLQSGAIETVTAAMTEENRVAAWRYNNQADGERSQAISAAEAFQDLDILLATLKAEHSYFQLNDVDADGAVAQIKERLSDNFSEGAFALEVAQFIVRFGDGHAGLRIDPSELLPPGYLPCLIGVIGERFVAFMEDRESLVDREHPYLLAIDGVPTAEWLAVAQRLTAQGSPQLRKERGARNVRYLNWIRQEIGLPSSSDVQLTLGTEVGQSTVDVTLPVSASKPLYGEWPRTMSGFLGEDVGYLRINDMYSPDDVPDLDERLHSRMDSYRDTRALIIDVRGNGGGTRHILKTLLPYFLDPARGPRVVNVAAKRLTDGDDGDDPDGLLGQTRGLFPANSPRHERAAQEAIATFAKTFRPRWKLPKGQFSQWHYMVVSPSTEGGTYFYDRPVAVLIDPSCFSATDIFTGAFKGVPKVTLVGTATGGGSGRSRSVRLPRSGYSLRLSSMASFQPNGSLYDGAGVQPDLTVYRQPTDFIGETDTVRDAAVALVTQ